MYIQVKYNQEKALQDLKRGGQIENIAKACKNKKGYEKPSVLKKRKLAEAKQRRIRLRRSKKN